MRFILQKNFKAAAGIKNDHLWTMGPQTFIDEIEEVDGEGFEDENLANLGTECAVYEGKPQKDGGPPKQFNLIDHAEPEPYKPPKLKRKK